MKQLYQSDHLDLSSFTQKFIEKGHIRTRTELQ